MIRQPERDLPRTQSRRTRISYSGFRLSGSELIVKDFREDPQSRCRLLSKITDKWFLTRTGKEMAAHEARGRTERSEKDGTPSCSEEGILREEALCSCTGLLPRKSLFLPFIPAFPSGAFWLFHVSSEASMPLQDVPSIYPCTPPRSCFSGCPCGPLSEQEPLLLTMSRAHYQ